MSEKRPMLQRYLSSIVAIIKEEIGKRLLAVFLRIQQLLEKVVARQLRGFEEQAPFVVRSSEEEISLARAAVLNAEQRRRDGIGDLCKVFERLHELVQQADLPSRAKYDERLRDLAKEVRQLAEAHSWLEETAWFAELRSLAAGLSSFQDDVFEHQPQAYFKDMPYPRRAPVSSPSSTLFVAGSDYVDPIPGTRQEFPTLSIGDGHLIQIEDLSAPIARGGFADLFMGVHRTSRATVALKRPRVGDDTATQAERHFHEEAAKWSSLKHENILEFWGMVEIHCQLYLVSPWMKGGSLQAFVKERKRCILPTGELDTGSPDYSRFSTFNETKSIHEIALGIGYLHENQVIHGDIKALNILIGPHGRAVLCDFGLSTVLDAWPTSSLPYDGSLRWQSPELCHGAQRDAKSDVWALSMTIVEILTGEYPLPHLNDFQFLETIVLGSARPSFEPLSGLGVDFKPLWDIASLCWEASPDKRPTVAEVIERLSPILS